MDDLQDGFCGIYEKVDGPERVKITVEWRGGSFGGAEYKVEKIEPLTAEKIREVTKEFKEKGMSCSIPDCMDCFFEGWTGRLIYCKKHQDQCVNHDHAPRAGER